MSDSIRYSLRKENKIQINKEYERNESENTSSEISKSEYKFIEKNDSSKCSSLYVNFFLFFVVSLCKINIT